MLELESVIRHLLCGCGIRCLIRGIPRLDLVQLTADKAVPLVGCRCPDVLAL